MIASTTCVSPRQKPGLYIPSLDGIRAVSFLTVFGAHAGLEKFIPGYLGLNFFFFLSGYLITTLLRLEADATGGINLRSFYLRRVLRIFPPFYVVLALALLISYLGIIRGSASQSGLPFQALHLTNYYIIRSGWWDGIIPGTWVYWSLAVEEHFYLVFPFLYTLMRRASTTSRSQALTLVGLCVVVLAWRCWLVFGVHAPKDRLYVATDTRVDSILFGCILALWGNPALDTSSISEQYLKRRWFPAGLGLLLLSVIIRDPQYAQTFRYTLQSIALIPIFIVAIRYPEWAPVRFLNNKWLKFIGILSYSLYLLHTVVIFGVRHWLPGTAVLQGFLALTISLLMAVAIYYTIELPCARLRKHLFCDWRRRPDAEMTVKNGDSTAPAPVVSEGRSMA